MPSPLAETVLVGTAGWSYRDWEGAVYPEGAGKSFDRLAYISSLFDLVEVNATYYRTLPPHVARSWLKRTQKGFLFTVKLLKSFTHSPDGPTKDETAGVRALLDVLMEEGRLGCLLAQFPQSFHNTEDARKRLADIAGTFSGYPTAAEVRHFSWARPEVLDFFARLKLAFVNPDQPEIRGTLPLTDHVTRDFAYFRFHGRNKKNWFAKEAGVDERYDWLYSKGELGELAAKVESAAARAEKTLVVFNNHFGGKAAAGGLRLMGMLGKPGPKPPPGIMELIREAEAAGNG